MGASFRLPGELPPEETIDVWVFSLTSHAAEPDENWDCVLSNDERCRAARFRFARDAVRFRHRRAALRVLLGRYLKQSASELVFTAAVHGKPKLSPESPLRFSTSHSEDLAAMAFTTLGEVGVDIEAIATDVSRDMLAYFTPAETAIVAQQSSADARIRMSLQFWARKEAIFKAAGYGLSRPPDSLDVAHRTIGCVHAGLDNGTDSPWRVEDLQMGPDFVGAIAAPPGGWIVRQWTLSNLPIATSITC